MSDNIRECRLRLLKVVSLFDEVTEDHIVAVFQNIVWIDPKKYPKGSLEYDFSFANKPKQKDVDRWMSSIRKKDMLDEVDLPVDEESFSSSSKEPDIFEKFYEAA